MRNHVLDEIRGFCVAGALGLAVEFVKFYIDDAEEDGDE